MRPVLAHEVQLLLALEELRRPDVGEHGLAEGAHDVGLVRDELLVELALVGLCLGFHGVLRKGLLLRDPFLDASAQDGRVLHAGVSQGPGDPCRIRAERHGLVLRDHDNLRRGLDAGCRQDVLQVVIGGQLVEEHALLDAPYAVEDVDGAGDVAVVVFFHLADVDERLPWKDWPGATPS